MIRSRCAAAVRIPTTVICSMVSIARILKGLAFRRNFSQVKNRCSAPTRFCGEKTVSLNQPVSPTGCSPRCVVQREQGNISEITGGSGIFQKKRRDETFNVLAQKEQGIRSMELCQNREFCLKYRNTGDRRQPSS